MDFELAKHKPCRDDAGAALGVITEDFDGDDDLDIYVANDITDNLLWMNDGTANPALRAPTPRTRRGTMLVMVGSPTP